MTNRIRLRAGLVLLGLGCAARPPVSEPPSPRAEPSDTEAAAVVHAEAIDLDVSGSPVMPRGLTSFGAASIDGSLYVLGGYFGRPHEYSSAGQSGELLRLDWESGRWARLGTRAKAQSVALVAHGERLVRIGGMRARNEAGSPADLCSLDTVEAFDSRTSTWSELPRLPSPRSSHDAVVVGDSVWVVGGWRLEGEQRTWHDTTLRLDLRDPEARWEEVDAPFQRRALATVAVEDRLVAIGGIDRSGKVSSSVDVFSISTGTWSKGPDLPGPGFGVAAAADDGHVFVSGMDGRVLRWGPGDPSWSEVSSLAFPRFFHRMVRVGAGELVVVGGIRDMGSGTRVRPLETVRTEPRPSWMVFELDSPLPSKNRQGVALMDHSLFLFGGNRSLGQHDFGPEFFTDEGAALDLLTMEWRTIAPYPVARQTMSTFVAPWGQLVSVGGFGHDGEVARSHPEIFAYHPGKDQWRQVGALPGHGRTQFGLAVHDQTVSIIGGLDYDPRRPQDDRFRHELPVLEAPLRATDLLPVATSDELPEPRRAFAGAELDGRVYVVGGMKAGFELVGRCEALDLHTRAWSEIACPHHERLSAQMVAMGGRLFLAAGSSVPAGGEGLSPDPSLEVYDPRTNEWTMLVESLPIEPKHLVMRVYGDRLVLLSTHDERPRATVLLLDPGLPRAAAPLELADGAASQVRVQ